jgi:hypothetical protein
MRVHAKAERRQRVERGRLPRGKVLAVPRAKIREENQPSVGDDARLQRALSVPAAALRGFTPAAAITLALFVQPLKAFSGITTSPRTSSACPCGTLTSLEECVGMLSGTLRMVRMFEVTSSPVCPSPRVSPDTRPRAAIRGRLVKQRHTQAVELQFGRVFDGQIAGQLAHAPVPVGQFLGGVGVVEREHGPRVLRLLESLGRLAAHALRRRVGVTSSGCAVSSRFSSFISASYSASEISGASRT